jgi:hypothetical protein
MERTAQQARVSEEWKARDRNQQIDCAQGGETMDKRGEMEKWEVKGQACNSHMVQDKKYIFES